MEQVRQQGSAFVMTGPRIRTPVRAAHDRLRLPLAGLTGEEAKASGALPGWTLARVLSHLEGICLGVTGQARYSLRGELIDVYDGGPPARNAAIEEGVPHAADAPRKAVGREPGVPLEGGPAPLPELGPWP